MGLTKWKIKNSIYLFPNTWNKKQVLNWANTDIRVCPNCGKIDVGLNHFNDCNPAMEAQRQQRMQDYYND